MDTNYYVDVNADRLAVSQILTDSGRWNRVDAEDPFHLQHDEWNVLCRIEPRILSYALEETDYVVVWEGLHFIFGYPLQTVIATVAPAVLAELESFDLAPVVDTKQGSWTGQFFYVSELGMQVNAVCYVNPDMAEGMAVEDVVWSDC